MSHSSGVDFRESHHSRRHFVVIILLALTLAVVAAIYARDLRQTRVSAAGERVFVTDIDRWRKTQRERAVETPYDFSLAGDLSALPLQVGEWQGVDIPQNNIEVLILLEPEQYVYRRYRRDDGKFLWLSVIGSKQAKSFHSPQICYTADGWRTEMSSEPIPLDGGGEIYGLRLVAEKEQWTHVALYFYLYPNYLREGDQGTTLFKVTAPLTSSLEETLALEKEFIRLFFTRVNL